jgi:ABC-type sugar transport system ATPase subunit
MPGASIEFDSMTKRFAGVTALDGVTLAIARGHCHGLVGENGAGKSTLAKILAGIHRADEGQLRIDGQVCRFSSPAAARRNGIGMVHQELAFCPDLSVAENLSMGRYPRRLGVFVDHAAMRRHAQAMLAQIGVSMDVRQPMRSLSTAQEQLVQVASAVGAGARILIFDEPTSSLSEPESQRLFALMDGLRAGGVTMIYVSHRLAEVFRLCDRISVLRDGRHVGTLDRADASEDRVVQLMIGRPLEQYFPRHLSRPAGDVMLSVRGLSSAGASGEVSFDVCAGEIVGLAGLMGAGRSEVARAIFGLAPGARGQVHVGGQPLRLGSVRSAMRHGVALVPEDRKRQGLVLMMSGRANSSLAMLDQLRRLGFLQRGRERRQASEYFRLLSIRAPSIESPVESLSGGNQQKVVLAKWLARGARVLIVDEPTRGVDVGAKAAIHQLIDELAQRGTAVLLISSELPEVLSLSSRILVMRQGRLVGQLSRQQASQEALLRLMAGVNAGAPAA